MASMVATCSSVLLPTPRPRLIPKSLVSPNPKFPKTFLHLNQTPAFLRCLKVRESRVLVPVMRASVGPYNNNCGRRDLWKRPVVQNQSDLVQAPAEVPRNKNSLMKFADSIWSFVFGDGNPNKGSHEENRWKLIEQYITSKGGVVAAEELAPYLDGFETSGKIPINEEKFMLPVLKRYEGHPEIDEYGNVLYRFMSLHPEDKELRDVEHKTFMEKKWQFSKISLFESAKVVLFGLVLRDVLSYLTKEWLLMKSGSTKLWAAVGLQLSVICFFLLIPLFRFMLFGLVFLLYKNAGIEKRNRARQQAAEALESPDLLLRQKIASARKMAGILKDAEEARDDNKEPPQSFAPHNLAVSL